MLTLNTGGTGDKLAVKVDAGSNEIYYEINGDDVQTSPADTYGSLAQGVVTTSFVAVLGPGSGHSYLVDNMSFFNTSVNKRTLTFCKTKNSTTYDATTQWHVVDLYSGEKAEWNGNGWTIYDATGTARVALGEPPTKVVHIFSGTTTYTPSAGTRALYVEAVGGGAGGGGVANAATNAGAAGGGGAGAYSAVYTTAIKSSFTVAVGAGGNGGTAGANNGSVGGDTTFDSASICTGKGGSGGIADTVAAPVRYGGLGGAGGLASSGVGDIKSDGGPGEGGIGCLAAAQACSGNGGISMFGSGAIGKKAQSAGGNAAGYGGGGSGGCILSGGASVAGGNGANGLLRIWEFQ